MFGKSEGVNRMREKNIYLYILKEMTWQPTIGWRKTLVLRQLLTQYFLILNTSNLVSNSFFSSLAQIHDLQK